MTKQASTGLPTEGTVGFFRSALPLSQSKEFLIHR